MYSISLFLYAPYNSNYGYIISVYEHLRLWITESSDSRYVRPLMTCMFQSIDWHVQVSRVYFKGGGGARGGKGGGAFAPPGNLVAPPRNLLVLKILIERQST